MALGECRLPDSAAPSKLRHELLTPADVPFPAGPYQSLTVQTWAICAAVASLSHDRLDRVASGKAFLSESLTDADLDRVKAGLRSVLGL